MASVDDRWYRRQGGRLVPTARHDHGMRWRVRYLDPAGRERGKSFARKTDADRFKATTEADMIRGTYLDPDAGKITLRKYAEHWMATRSWDPSTRETMERLIRLHIIPGLGHYRLDQLARRPSIISGWLRGLTK
jgi:hypothetical protein